MAVDRSEAVQHSWKRDGWCPVRYAAISRTQLRRLGSARRTGSGAQGFGN